MFSWKLQDGTVKKQNNPPSYYVKTVTNQSDGLFQIKLDYAFDVTLSNCVEIFPDTKRYQTYVPLTEDELRTINTTPVDMIQMMFLMGRGEARSHCCIFENKTEGKYYFWLDSVKFKKPDEIKQYIWKAHMTLKDVEKMYNASLNEKGVVDNKLIDEYVAKQVESTSIQISPYDANNASIAAFGTFFNEKKTHVSGSSNTMYIVIGVSILVVLMLAAAGYYYYNKNNKNNKNENNTVTKFSFGRIKRKRRNVK